eukprot:7030520-Pyramimonas_sp.AAC.1
MALYIMNTYITTATKTCRTRRWQQHVALFPPGRTAATGATNDRTGSVAVDSVAVLPGSSGGRGPGSVAGLLGSCE